MPFDSSYNFVIIENYLTISKILKIIEDKKLHLKNDILIFDNLMLFW